MMRRVIDCGLFATRRLSLGSESCSGKHLSEQIAGLRSDISSDIRSLERKMEHDLRILQLNIESSMRLAAATEHLEKQQENGVRIVVVSFFVVAFGAVWINNYSPNNYFGSNRDSEDSAAAPRVMTPK